MRKMIQSMVGRGGVPQHQRPAGWRLSPTNEGENMMTKTARKALIAAGIVAGTLGFTGQTAGAHPHTVNGRVIANGQNHGGYVNGVSCGGDPAAYGLETAHHGPDAGTPGKADGDCYQTTGRVPPALDDSNPAID